MFCPAVSRQIYPTYKGVGDSVIAAPESCLGDAHDRGPNPLRMLPRLLRGHLLPDRQPFPALPGLPPESRVALWRRWREGQSSPRVRNRKVVSPLVSVGSLCEQGSPSLCPTIPS